MPDFNRILAQFPGLLSIKLQGMGEPLLNRELVDMLREGEKRGISMQFITNGTVLDPSLAGQLLDLKRTHIGFSLDGATAETFESIRTGASFDKVVANIRELTRRRGKHVYPLISVTAVVTRHNLHEIPVLVRLAKELGVDSINLQTALTNWGKQEMDHYNETIRVSPQSEQVDAVFREAKRIAGEIHIDLHIWREDYYTKRNKCPWPWKRAFVAANGDVVPCCILADSDTIKMGNLFEQSFAEIWNSQPYRDFRHRIKSHRLHDFCKNCYRD
jgi:pyrroloquinoline quinone biosynthesis protein E